MAAEKDLEALKARLGEMEALKDELESSLASLQERHQTLQTEKAATEREKEEAQRLQAEAEARAEEEKLSRQEQMKASRLFDKIKKKLEKKGAEAEAEAKVAKESLAELQAEKEAAEASKAELEEDLEQKIKEVKCAEREKRILSGLTRYRPTYPPSKPGQPAPAGQVTARPMRLFEVDFKVQKAFHLHDVNGNGLLDDVDEMVAVTSKMLALSRLSGVSKEQIRLEGEKLFHALKSRSPPVKMVDIHEYTTFWREHFNDPIRSPVQPGRDPEALDLHSPEHFHTEPSPDPTPNPGGFRCLCRFWR